jgi:hypothetical protein
MTTNVYWACIEPEWMLAQEPESVASIFYKKNLHDSKNGMAMLNHCPSFNKNLKNLFALRSIYDYDFIIDDEKITSNFYDEQFFNNHVNVRDINKRLFSFKQCFIFFTDSPSLEVTFYEHPYLEDNNITERCMIVAGQFNIGKWFRNTEFAFYLKKDYNSFKIERGEIFTYLRFHTDEKINFQQFRFNEKLHGFVNDGFVLNSPIGALRNLENYYKSFKNKKLILNEIKDNLL